MYKYTSPNLFPKLIAGKGQDTQSLGGGVLPMQLYQLVVVLGGELSLGCHIDNQCHMTPVKG